MSNNISVTNILFLQWVEEHYASLTYVQMMVLLRRFAKENQLRLSTELSVSPLMAFASREIQVFRYQLINNGLTVYLTVNFGGLQGSGSPLPLHYPEAILQTDPDENVLNNFYNFFNRQWLICLENIMQKYRPLALGSLGNVQQLTSRIIAFCGMYYHTLPKEVSMTKMLSLSAHLVGGQANQWQVCQILQRYFAIPKVRLRRSRMVRIAIPQEALNSLGCHASRLGFNAIIGEYVNDPTYQFKVMITVKRPDTFLPHTDRYCQLVALVRWLRRTAVSFVIVLCCERLEPMQLSGQNKTFLGWTSLLGFSAQSFQITLPFVS